MPINTILPTAAKNIEKRLPANPQVTSQLFTFLPTHDAKILVNTLSPTLLYHQYGFQEMKSLFLSFLSSLKNHPSKAMRIPPCYIELAGVLADPSMENPPFCFLVNIAKGEVVENTITIQKAIRKLGEIPRSHPFLKFLSEKYLSDSTTASVSIQLEVYLAFLRQRQLADITPFSNLLIKQKNTLLSSSNEWQSCSTSFQGMHVKPHFFYEALPSIYQSQPFETFSNLVKELLKDPITGNIELSFPVQYMLTPPSILPVVMLGGYWNKRFFHELILLFGCDNDSTIVDMFVQFYEQEKVNPSSANAIKVFIQAINTPYACEALRKIDKTSSEWVSMSIPTIPALCNLLSNTENHPLDRKVGIEQLIKLGYGKDTSNQPYLLEQINHLAKCGNYCKAASLGFKAHFNAFDLDNIPIMIANPETFVELTSIDSRNIFSHCIQILACAANKKALDIGLHLFKDPKTTYDCKLEILMFLTYTFPPEEFDTFITPICKEILEKPGERQEVKEELVQVLTQVPSAHIANFLISHLETITANKVHRIVYENEGIIESLLQILQKIDFDPTYLIEKIYNPESPLSLRYLFLYILKLKPSLDRALTLLKFSMDEPQEDLKHAAIEVAATSLYTHPELVTKRKLNFYLTAPLLLHGN